VFNDQLSGCHFIHTQQGQSEGLRHFQIPVDTLQPDAVQALVLHALYDEENISAGELGKRLGLDSATLSGVLDRMEENGWLIRNAFKEDKRVVNIVLTEKSRQIRDRFLKETSELNREILSIFNTEERLLFVRMLKDLRK
jgi:DNA-binding MarR family transcriptional regulator